MNAVVTRNGRSARTGRRLELAAKAERPTDLTVVPPQPAAGVEQEVVGLPLPQGRRVVHLGPAIFTRRAHDRAGHQQLQEGTHFGRALGVLDQALRIGSRSKRCQGAHGRRVENPNRADA